MAISSGVIITKNLTPTKFTQKYVIPASISKVLIKNKGQTDIKICFDNDTEPYIIDRDEVLPTLEVKAEQTTIKYSSETGKGLLNLILWG